MISLTRSLSRQVRSVFRRAGIGRSMSSPARHITVNAGPNGLVIAGFRDGVAIERHEPGNFPAESLTLPTEFLEDCEGRQPDPVTIERRDRDHVTASFTDRGVPQIIEYTVDRETKPITSMVMPDTMPQNGPELLAGLRGALDSADKEAIRYALNHLQLRGGEAGRIAATDGHQVFIQSGPRFPWEGDLLVPASNVFRSAELPTDQPVEIGLVDQHVVLRVGPWTIGLVVNREGRFPTMESVIPQASGALSRLRLSNDDAQFLRQAIGRLPSSDPVHCPVTLELNGRVAIRARGVSSSPVTELLLSRSTCEGDTLVCNLNRRFLERAIELGFQDLCFYGPERPILCEDGPRQFVFLPQAAKGAVVADDSTVRVDSATAGASPGAAVPRPKSPPSRRTIPLDNSTTTNGRKSTTQSDEPVVADQTAGDSQAKSASAIEQAEALQVSLRDTLGKTRDLIAALRRERKHARLMKSTVDSLKQLQRLTA